MLKDKKIVVTGAAGSIGSELTRQLAKDNEVLAIDINEIGVFRLFEELRDEKTPIQCLLGDVRDKNVFTKAKAIFGYPEYIFHAAALKHVITSSWWPDEYIKTNILGTLNVISAAKRLKAKLINISTDKTVNASSMMGATKFVSEMMVRDAGFVSVRFGNVLGSRGSVLEIWERQIAEGQPVTITDKRMKRFMMTIGEAVGLIIRAAEIGQPSQVIILKMGDQVSILELAQKILKEKRSKVGLKVIGMNVGEKLGEVLMTDEEQKRAREVENFWVIPPEWINFTKDKHGYGLYIGE